MVIRGETGTATCALTPCLTTSVNPKYERPACASGSIGTYGNTPAASLVKCSMLLEICTFTSLLPARTLKLVPALKFCACVSCSEEHAAASSAVPQSCIA